MSGNQSVESFKQILGNASQLETGFIVLQHDLYMQTVDIAVGYTLNLALNNTPSLKLEPIGTCQGWPGSDLYLETTTNSTFPYPNSPAASGATTTASARATGAAAQGSSSGARLQSSVSGTSLMLAGLSVLAGGLLVV